MGYIRFAFRNINTNKSASATGELSDQTTVPLRTRAVRLEGIRIANSFNLSPAPTVITWACAWSITPG